MNITFTSLSFPTQGSIVIAVNQSLAFDTVLGNIHQQLPSLTSIFNSENFKGKQGTSVKLIAPHPLTLNKLIVVGTGEAPLNALACEELGGRLYDGLAFVKDEQIVISLSSLEFEGLEHDQAVALVANGLLLKSWRFDRYKTKEEEDRKPSLKNVAFMATNPALAQDYFKPLAHITEGVFLTRHVVSEPPNVIYPKTMAKAAQELSALGVEVEILSEEDMRLLGMHALLGVSQGSAFEPQLVIMKWLGGPSGEPPLAVVGKGVTFDTGGISIKPANNMDEMKADMAGAGTVLGLMKSLAARQAKVNVIGVMGLVENMPSGTAQRPGDIVTSMSGQTIEVLNTDAEGRLVLADALWYTQEKFNPHLIIDLATLTGAIIVALGYEYAGMFSNNDTLAQHLIEAGEKSGEKLWRLPLHKAYDKDIDSDVADMKNIGSGRGAGSTTAAQFLQRFVKDVPWAHLDIAATAFDKKGRPLSQKGATAFGVRILNQLVSDHYETQ